MGLSTSFRGVNIRISTHSDSTIIENIGCSFYIGEKCSIASVCALEGESLCMVIHLGDLTDIIIPRSYGESLTQRIVIPKFFFTA